MNWDLKIGLLLLGLVLLWMFVAGQVPSIRLSYLFIALYTVVPLYLGWYMAKLEQQHPETKLNKRGTQEK